MILIKTGPAVTKSWKILKIVCTSRQKSQKSPMLEVFIYIDQSLKSSNV